MSKRPPNFDKNGIRPIQDTLKARYEDLLDCVVSPLRAQADHEIKQSGVKQLLISS